MKSVLILKVDLTVYAKTASTDMSTWDHVTVGSLLLYLWILDQVL